MSKTIRKDTLLRMALRGELVCCKTERDSMFETKDDLPVNVIDDLSEFRDGYMNIGSWEFQRCSATMNDDGIIWMYVTSNVSYDLKKVEVSVSA